MNRRAVARRDFLRVGAGALAARPWAGSWGPGGRSSRPRPGGLSARLPLLSGPAAPARVSLVKGKKRYDIVFEALKLIEEEVVSSIGRKRILIKPNIVLSDCAACVTHVDAVRAVLDFLAPHVKGRILIGESGVQDTMKGFLYNGYGELEKNYDVELLDLNRDTYRTRYVLGLNNAPTPIRIIDTFFDPGLYIISIARMKTHNYVFVTLSIKNVIMAAPLNDARATTRA